MCSGLNLLWTLAVVLRGLTRVFDCWEIRQESESKLTLSQVEYEASETKAALFRSDMQLHHVRGNCENLLACLFGSLANQTGKREQASASGNRRLVQFELARSTANVLSPSTQPPKGLKADLTAATAPGLLSPVVSGRWQVTCLSVPVSRPVWGAHALMPLTQSGGRTPRSTPRKRSRSYSSSPSSCPARTPTKTSR
jgi:hypothetical protein